jgi:3-hydroxyisobutyrate dehydrogenase
MVGSIMRRIAFIGTGGMGQGMARNLLEAGYHLTVCNRSPARAQLLVDAGAALAPTPGAAAADADAIIAMVGDDHDSRAVWLGRDGVLAGRPKPGAIAIESSTLSLGWVQELDWAVRAAGLCFVDSPVTGGRQGAQEGMLTLLVGADKEVLARARPLMEAYSREIVHFGPPGAGTSYKLVVNLMVGVQAAALAEGLLLAEKCGLDMDQVVRSLATGAAASPVVRAYASKMVRGDHGEPIDFVARWMHKDMVYGLELAAQAGQAMPTSAVAAQVHRLGLARGLGDSNVTAVVEALR